MASDLEIGCPRLSPVQGTFGINPKIMLVLKRTTASIDNNLAPDNPSEWVPRFGTLQHRYSYLVLLHRSRKRFEQERSHHIPNFGD